ncbi:hypothetical protein [Nocardioides panacihumi]|uniref:hypothetical protein n=1 Tax=Nocardioides panacihumi TaxID=400774 RepID=UPI0031D7785C
MMTSLRRLRTQRALAVAGLVAVAAPLLSSCGFNYATDRPNVIANGGYHIEGDIHVLAARIVAPSDGTGTFVATITVDPSAADTKLTGLSGDGVTAGTFTPIEVKSGGSANLFTDGGIPVTGDFKAGDDKPVTLTFDNGSSIEVGAVVVKQCHEYSDVQTLPSKQSGKAQASTTAEPYTCEYPSAAPSAEAH